MPASPMNARHRLDPLPHEWVFGGFLVSMWLRLWHASGPGSPGALVFLGSVLLILAAIVYCHLRESKARWMARLWACVIVMNVVFMNMKTAVPMVMPMKFDGFLSSIDRMLFGMTLSGRAGAIATPLITEILSFCYLLFFPYLLAAICYYSFVRDLPLLKRFMTGLFTIYGVGFLGYSLIPAGGPHLAYPGEFSAPLHGWAITRLNAWIVAEGSNGVDVFPSLHCAVSCYLLFFDRRHSPWRFRLYLLPCLGIWVATIYLRYHYAVDLVAGFLLAAAALLLTKRWAEPSSNQPTL